jgi:two-component system LytT family sensor kinase
MTEHILLGSYLAASLIGFAAGSCISVLLLVLTWRAAKLPGTPAANIQFSVCSLVWNLGGFALSVAITSGVPEGSRTAQFLLAFQFTGAALWPVSLLRIWSPLAVRPWQRGGFRALQVLAVLSGAVVTVSLWSAVCWSGSHEVPLFLQEYTAYNATILLAMGMTLIRDHLASRAMRMKSLAILAGVVGASMAAGLSQAFPYYSVFCTVLSVTAEQSTLLLVLGAFFLFTRLRSSDLFIHYSLRILMAALTAVAFLLVEKAPFLVRTEQAAAFPEAAQVLAGTLLIAVLLFSFTFVDRHIEACVERWIFRAPDYRDLVGQLSERLSQARSEPEIADAAENSTRDALDLKEARLVALQGIQAGDWKNAILDGEVLELDLHDPLRARLPVADVELVIPVRSAGHVSHVLAVARGPARRGLVTHEVTYLRSTARLIGQRLDALLLEEQMVEQRGREAVLLQQVTEAELCALRAQINPHFLFNSLNSIANLIVTHPDQAESMTLRLARVFRHVLANSARPLIPLREEIEFLRTYLQIEEARFGSRLAVSIEVDPAISMESIPSLILQPIVENALKHGLGPKPGQGHLWIRAEAHEDHLRLSVEDDGVGPVTGALEKRNGWVFVRPGNGDGEPSSGVGLENIARRLNALYREQGRIILDEREGGGTRVTVLLPREKGIAAL